MTLRGSLLAVAAITVASVFLFWLFRQQVAGPAPVVQLPPEVEGLLQESLADQKLLATLDAEQQQEYRQRFERLETTLGRLRIVEHHQAELKRSYDLLMGGLLALSIALATTVLAVRHARYRPRLRRVQDGLEKLAQGEAPVRISDGGRDAVGRIARMIESASRAIAVDRRRLLALQHLSRWQEAARRFGHEIKTPLTGALLDLDRLRNRLADEHLESGEEVREALDEIGEELHRLGRFTEQFSAFARLPEPRPMSVDLRQLVAEFVTTYEKAWPNLRLEFAGDVAVPAAVDRDLFRQVLANLCDNSAKAAGRGRATVRFVLKSDAAAVRLVVSDDGPGVAEEVRDRLFEPYATTAEPGVGTGLGLAISRKVLLDHGGDLELVDSPLGATFALVLPAVSTP